MNDPYSTSDWLPSHQKIVNRFGSVLIAIGMITGIVIRNNSPLAIYSIAIIFMSGLTGLSIRFFREKIGLVSIVIMSSCCGYVLHHNHLQDRSLLTLFQIEQEKQSSLNHIEIESLVNEQDFTFIRIKGVINNKPYLHSPPLHSFSLWTPLDFKTSFILNANHIETENGFMPAKGKIRVNVQEPFLTLLQNDHVEITGKLYRISEPTNPYGFNWHEHYKKHGIIAGFICQHKQNVRVISKSARDTSLFNLHKIKKRFRAMIIEDLPFTSDEEKSLRQALILGNRNELSRKTNDTFIRAGVAHLLAVSGIHVGIVLMLAWITGRFIFFEYKLIFTFMIIVLLIYALITEPRPSILRATIMGMLYCITKISRRKNSQANWIAVSCIILLMVDTSFLYSPGFQLSFSAVLGIFYLKPLLSAGGHEIQRIVTNLFHHTKLSQEDYKLLHSISMHNKNQWGYIKRISFYVRHSTKEGFFFGLAAWLATAPVVAWHFNMIQPWGILTSVIIIPFFTITMLTGFLSLLMSPVPVGNNIADFLLRISESLFLRVVKNLEAIPGSNFITGQPDSLTMISYYLFIISLVYCYSKTNPDEESNLEFQNDIKKQNEKFVKPFYARRISLTAFILFFLSLITWRSGMKNDQLIISFFDAGRGTTTILELPGGETIFYDAGTSHFYDIGYSSIDPYLKKRGINSIHSIYISHPNLDHFSAVPHLITHFNTGPVIFNSYFKDFNSRTSPSFRLYELLQEMDHPIEEVNTIEQSWHVGDVKFEWIWPLESFDIPVDSNDTSTVIRVTFKGTKILFTGDIEEYAQQQLMESKDISCDILALPHHGAVVSNTRDFIEATGAKVLIRSHYEKTRVSKPLIKELSKSFEYYNTADNGAVQVFIDENEYTIMTYPGLANKPEIDEYNNN